MSEMTVTDKLVLDAIDEFARSQTGADDDGEVWGSIGTDHRQMIERYGFASFKRHINFQYGQWAVSTLRSRFTLTVLAALIRRGVIPRHTRVDWSDADGIIWPDEEPNTRWRLRAYAFYCGLLWQYAVRHDRLGAMRALEPSLGRPMPIYFGGRLISQDIAMASLDLNRMADEMPLMAKTRVLEIGAGYGRLAYLLRSLVPNVQYSIVDISPALAISQGYLTSIFGEASGMRFLLPHQLDEIPDNYFDLALNVSSFDEMPPAVSIGYLKTIGRVCRGHLFLSGYARSSHRGQRLGVDELPYDPTWKAVYDAPHNLFPGWVDRVFQIK
jgi:putative sugar O-methyltransferase